MKKRFKKVKILCFLAIIFAFIVFYAFKIEPNLLIVRQETIAINQNPQNELKIVLFADTHFKTDSNETYTKKIVQKINEQEPDVVMFLGDLIDDQQETPVDEAFIIEQLSLVQGQKLAIMGNHDYGGGAQRTYESIMENSGFNILVNQSVTVEDVIIYGIDDLYFGNPDYSILDEVTTSQNVLLMLHEGDMIEKINPVFDMAFSGHSHGGQIAIPFISEKIMPEGAKNYIKGLYENENIYVTSGIGTSVIDARLFCIPEIVVINLQY